MERELLTERNWLAAFVATLAALVGGSLALPEAVYNRFVWQYFWGPVYSDAHNARCAIKGGGDIRLEQTDAACEAAASSEVAAYTGYTLVSEVGYIVTLVFMILGVLLLLERLDLARDRRLLFSPVPFMLFGGALRTVEDASDAAVTNGVEPMLTYPLNTLLISPIIYVTVFVLTLGALLVSVRLSREGLVESKFDAMTTIGVGLLALTLAYLIVLALSVDYVDFYAQILVLDVGIASVLAYGIYRWLEENEPAVNAGTGAMGLVILWSQAIDGVANVIAADFATALGHTQLYDAKHPLNQMIIDATASLQPAAISDVIGTSWPFLVVKMAFAVGIVWLFNEEIFEESPRYANLLLIAATAVGLGPGTRDILRVTLGI